MPHPEKEPQRDDREETNHRPSWTSTGKKDEQRIKRMAPQVGLESGWERTFNNIQSMDGSKSIPRAVLIHVN
jgi:hypothetical protein